MVCPPPAKKLVNDIVCERWEAVGKMKVEAHRGHEGCWSFWCLQFKCAGKDKPRGESDGRAKSWCLCREHSGHRGQLVVRTSGGIWVACGWVMSCKEVTEATSQGAPEATGECKSSAISPSRNQQVNFHQQLHSICVIRIPSLNQSVWIPLAKSCRTNVLETFSLVSNKTWRNFETVQSTQ